MMSNITEELNKIKHAVYGKEVRQAIHDAIKQVYDDASFDGDTNMEVILARGVYDVLNDRLNASDQELSRKANQSDVNKKADKEYVDDLFTNLDGLEIKGGFDTIRDLESAYPNGTTGLFVVDENLYAWNGAEWKVVKKLEVMPWSEFLTVQGEEWVI